MLHRGELPHPAFISPLPTLPLKGAGFARWPLRSLPRWFVECGTIRERRDCVRLVALQSRAVHTRPHAQSHSPPLTSLRHTIRRVAIVACLATSACAAPVTADDLVALSASDNTTCREIRQDSATASRGISRTIRIEVTRPASRSVFVAVDSSNHPRFFSSMVNRRAGTTMKMQSASAAYDATGRMLQAVRTFTTRDITSGTGDSKSVALSDADTARVRSLTAEVLRRCIR